MMDMGVEPEAGVAVQIVDLSTFDLPLLLANDHEGTAHEALLTGIDKASKGKTVWRAVMA
ncbi:MAG: DNA polymerase-3 subunit epsilon [Polaromonas sp.]